MNDGNEEAGTSLGSRLAAGATGKSTLAVAMSIDEDDPMIDDGSTPVSVEERPTMASQSVRPIGVEMDGMADIDGIYDDGVNDNPPLNLHPQYTSSTMRDLLAAEISGILPSNGVKSYRTGYVYAPAMMLHMHPANEMDPDSSEDESGDGSPSRRASPHPEQPARIKHIYQRLRDGGCITRMVRIRIREITRDEILLVHAQDMWEGLERTMAFKSETLSLQSRLLDSMSSLYVNAHSARCAKLSCGGVVEMCDAVASGQVRNGFAIVRPPGHHAEPDKAMGFCFYNNVAVAARWLQQKYGKATDETRCKRIIILDWDVHHGNGTQSAFWDDPDILYISIHRFENGTFYPGGQAGSAKQIGAGRGEGRNVNIPWPTAGMGDGDYLAAFQRIVMPIATEFSPDLVIISAGFDAARGDELGRCDVTPNGYAHMAYDLARLANGKLVVALEGGYNLDSIASSALEVTEVLLGGAPKALEEGVVCTYSAHQTLRMVEHIQADHWKCMHRVHGAPEEIDADDGVNLISVSAMLSAHRTVKLARQFNLAVLDIGSDRGAAHCLCSPDLLNPETQNIVLFAHDMGNLRVEPPWSQSIEPEKELGYLVDASSGIVEWAQSTDFQLLDINLNTESPTSWERTQQMGHLYDGKQREEARRVVLQVWDETVNLLHTAAGGEGKPLNVILIGLGAGCDALVNLIEKRKVKDCVRAVVQLPYQAQVPGLLKDSTKRKWYFGHSRVYLPHNHAIFHDEDNLLLTAKRFGKVIRSVEVQAARVLRCELADVKTFIGERLMAAK